MMKRLLLLIPVIIIIGCGLFGGEDYFPLKVGNEWKYEGYAYTIVDSANAKQETKITGEDQINNEDVFIFVEKATLYSFWPTPDTTEYIDTSYVKETKDTILRYSSKTDTMPMLIAVLPLEVNKTWTQVYGTDTIRYTVKTKEDVTVPAGTYKNCWKIEMKFNTITEYHWYADGTGNVKWTMDGFLLELTEAMIK